MPFFPNLRRRPAVASVPQMAPPAAADEPSVTVTWLTQHQGPNRAQKRATRNSLRRRGRGWTK